MGEQLFCKQKVEGSSPSSSISRRIKSCIKQLNREHQKRQYLYCSVMVRLCPRGTRVMSRFDLVFLFVRQGHFRKPHDSPSVWLDESGRIQYVVSRSMCRMSAEGSWSAKSVRLVQLQLGTFK